MEMLTPIINFTSFTDISFIAASIIVFCMCITLLYISSWTLAVMMKWKTRLNLRKSQKMVQVECWFCGAVTTVPPGNKNCFDCPECEQYNGFTEDGNYNKPIPAQYSEELNQAYTRPDNNRDGCYDNKPNLLCHVCQVNQELKIQQLSAFVPMNEDNFDAEVAEYSQYLERAYRLCPACDATVYNELSRQDRDIQTKLLGQRLNHAVMTSTQVSPHFYTARKKVAVFRILSVLIACLVVAAELGAIFDLVDLENDEPVLSKASVLLTGLTVHRISFCLIGVGCSLLSSFIAGKYRLKYLDCMCPLLWLAYMGIITYPHPSSLHLLLQAASPAGVTGAPPLLLSTGVLGACIIHALQARIRTTKKVFTNRLRQSEGETSSHHYAFREKPSDPSLSSSTETNSSSASHSLRGESVEIKRILLDQDIMGGLSLGPPVTSRPKNKDIWTAHTPPTSRPATPVLEERPSSRECRPVISPATFNPCGLKRTASQSSFATSFTGAFRETCTDSGRGSCVPRLRDDSSDDSLPLGMSAKEQSNPSLHLAKNKRYIPDWSSFLLPCIFGFSLGINFAAAIYFMYGR